MSESTNNLNLRLTYQSGDFVTTSEGRFQNDKLRSLKKALIYSYQSCTILLSDGRKFRCLLNPSKLKPDYDVKILSIPFKDVPLNPELITLDEEGNPEKTSDGIETIGIKCGDIFEWVETSTMWLVLSRHIEEDAYFRAEVRRCDQKCLIGNDEEPQWCYIRGPVETTINWAQKGGIEYNTLNYSLIMYVPKTKTNLEQLHRFSKVKVAEKVEFPEEYIPYDEDGNETYNWRPWKVAAVDPYYYDNIIEVMLEEDYKNTIDDKVQEELAASETEDTDEDIIGETSIKGFASYTYTTPHTGGTWKTNLMDAVVASSEDQEVTLNINTGKVGSFKLYYIIDENTYYDKTIKIVPI